MNYLFVPDKEQQAVWRSLFRSVSRARDLWFPLVVATDAPETESPAWAAYDQALSALASIYGTYPSVPVVDSRPGESLLSQARKGVELARQACSAAYQALPPVPHHYGDRLPFSHAVARLVATERALSEQHKLLVQFI